jgi:hypothetical protein
MQQLTTLTVIIRDNYEPLSDPLIYVVRVESLDHDTVLAAVNVERLKDLSLAQDELDELELDELDLTLCFAFPGELSTVADWRE